MREEEIVEFLKKENEGFRQLYHEHRQLDASLAELTMRHYLTPEEEIEKKRLQKEKLVKKDKIAAVVRDYRAHQPTA
jgi:hypothetical protein